MSKNFMGFSDEHVAKLEEAGIVFNVKGAGNFIDVSKLPGFPFKSIEEIEKALIKYKEDNG